MLEYAETLVAPHMFASYVCFIHEKSGSGLAALLFLVLSLVDAADCTCHSGMEGYLLQTTKPSITALLKLRHCEATAEDDALLSKATVESGRFKVELV